jgi:outer membrane protein assembly factor BamD
VKKHFVHIIIGFLTAVTFVSCGSSSSSVTAQNSLEFRFNEGKQAFEKGDLLDAIKIFEEVRMQAPTSSFAVDAMYLGAYARYLNKNYITAAADFRSFRRTYPTSPLAARAQFMAAESYYGMSPRAELDQTYTNYALSEYQLCIKMYTDDKQITDSCELRIAELRGKLASKQLLTAELYLKLQARKPALLTFERVLDQYYDTPAAIEATLRIAELQSERGKMKEAREAIDRFDDRYLQQATPQQRERAKRIKQLIAVR